MVPRRLLYTLGFVGLSVVAPVGYQVDRLAHSVPPLDGELPLAGLSAPATVASDRLGIPSVSAASREDAYRVLGYLHARDRLFQMDLMRRKAAGRLAELFGEQALPTDQAQRAYQFRPAAEAIIAALPDWQKAVLEAYTAGVNGYLGGTQDLPPEFRLLNYRPEAWRPSDSLLVALGMFQTLNDQEQDERMLTVLEQRLPPAVTAFLTPDTDAYARTLLGGNESWRPAQPVPVEAIASLLEEGREQRLSAARVDAEPLSVGSNNWAVGAAKTKDGRAIIANDMHLPLSVPGVWYRARLRYPGYELSGITLPGVPLVVAGSNGRVAWGFTNVDGDTLDLVRLEIDPTDPDRYRTPGGWRKFARHTETIAVKDAPPVTITLSATEWGPVSPRPLLGQPVAIRWTALDPRAVNLELLDMDRAFTLEHAMAVLNRAGAPPQNAVLADDRGRIAWTYMGFFPRRVGFDGSASRSWADGRRGWDGFLPPEELPRVVDPPEGYIATANNRTLGKGYPHIIGHSFGHSYRAHRIAEWLAPRHHLTEADLMALQLDTVSEFYEFYRRLALDTLRQAPPDPALAEVERAIRQWNGRLDPDSLGIGLLVRWRQDLATAVFGPMVARCGAEPGFRYAWREQETPLRALLEQRIPATLPSRHHANWQDFLLDTLRASAAALRQEHPGVRLDALPWGRINRVAIQHPFSRALPLAGWLLDMPEVAGGCNSFCLKVLHGVHGASVRLTVSPNHPEDGILHIPGGQSGHPFSPHYRDQQPAWEQGRPLPFLPQQPDHTLTLLPG